MATELHFTVWVEAPFTDESIREIGGDLARDIARRTIGAEAVLAEATVVEHISKADVEAAHEAYNKPAPKAKPAPKPAPKAAPKSTKK